MHCKKYLKSLIEILTQINILDISLVFVFVCLCDVSHATVSLGGECTTNCKHMYYTSPQSFLLTFPFSLA